MENQEELERKILEIVKERHDKTGGNNGSLFGDFNSLNLEQSVINALIQKMHDEKKITIRLGINNKIVMLPKY